MQCVDSDGVPAISRQAGVDDRSINYLGWVPSSFDWGTLRSLPRLAGVMLIVSCDVT